MYRKSRVAINGFGRIGRAFYRAAKDNPDLEIVAVNDLGDVANLAYLLRFDTAYGRVPYDVAVGTPDEQGRPRLDIDHKHVVVVQEKDATRLPWGELDIDVVVECSGAFVSCGKSHVHINAGAKRVVVSAPFSSCVDPDIAQGTVLMGVNESDIARSNITSNASCTSNAVAPIIAILHEAIGVEKAMLNTTHAYTATQRLIDGPSEKDFRVGRAAAQNLVPASTGASYAVTEVIKELVGKFEGIALRVPVITGSVADITFVAKRPTTVDEVNDILRKASADPRWKGVFTVTEDPIVSSDVVGEPFGAIADLAMTRVAGGDLVKVFSWYDNEAGYTNTLVRHVELVARQVAKDRGEVV